MRTLTALWIISTAIAVGSASAEDPVYFGDAGLKAAVEETLRTSDPTPTDMLGLTKLVYVNQGLSTLAGLEFATNLQTLDLCHNEIWQITNLSTLSHLKWLSLNNNCLSDISVLAGMHDLEYLDVHDNKQIVSISVLAGLTHLNTLLIYRLGISNISALSNLSGLQTLYLKENPISDISPLLTLTCLTYLNVLLDPLNEQACTQVIPELRANNPGITIVYHPCVPPRLVISSTPGGSVVSPGQGEFSYPYGQTVLLEANPDPGFVFVNWSGSYFTSANPTFITMDQDYQIQANFAKKP